MLLGMGTLYNKETPSFINGYAYNFSSSVTPAYYSSVLVSNYLFCTHFLQLKLMEQARRINRYREVLLFLGSFRKLSTKNTTKFENSVTIYTPRLYL